METANAHSDSGPGHSLRLLWFCEEFLVEEEGKLFETIHRQSKDKRFRKVAQVLDNAVAVLKEELALLDSDAQQSVPLFTSILDVVGYRNIPQLCLGGAIRHFLLIVLHLALYIGSYEHELPHSRRRWPRLLVGLSAGTLSAAAVAIATSLDHLASIGAESARIAFRIGIRVQHMSRLLEPRAGIEGEHAQSWAYVVTTLSVDEIQAELATWNHATCNEALTRLYISAADASGVVVTGPPSRLKRAFEASTKLRHAKWAPLPIYDGLAHAPHLYDLEAVAHILQPLQKHPLLESALCIPLLSPDTGQPYSARNGLELLAEVTSTILTAPIHLDAVCKGVLTWVSRHEQPSCDFARFEPCRASCRVVQALQALHPTCLLTHSDLLAWTRMPSELRDPRGEKQSKLAVVGMSCRMPGGADSPLLFWNLLMEGKDTCRAVPSDRFNLDQHYDPTGKVANTTKVRHGNFIHEPGRFDAAFFNMSPREADNTDPAARLALVCAYEALAMAGYSPNRTRSTVLDRVGTYLGQASDDWRELNASQNINAFIVPGGVRAFANGRINYFFKFGGPSLNIDTACSSGLAAVQAACSALWANEIDTAIAGGINIITDPDNYCGLGSAGFLSPTGQCKVWDESADGYCRADGVGTIVLKRLEDAEADNDNIIAVLLAGATNHSAFAPSITHPHVGAQVANYLRVVRDAGINPLDVTYAELHGTGTQAGDAVEAQSIETVFAPPRPRRGLDQKLFLGAVKSNIGHAEAAAGIASMIKVLLCFQHEKIPAHIGIRTRINPIISRDFLGSQGAVLTQQSTPWPRPSSGRRLALVNSFGAHGGNTTMLLEEYLSPSRIGVDPRKVYPIVISARSGQSLKGNVQRLLEQLQENPETLLGDLSYSLCARSMHHNHRIGTICASISDVKSWLAAALTVTDNSRPSPVHGHKIVFAFTGQGSFHPGIAAQLVQEFSIFRNEIARLNEIVISVGCSPVLINSRGQTLPDEDASPITEQVTIVVVEIALAALLAKLNITPSLVVGHSLGEYAALVISGIISAADAIMLVVKRGDMLQKHCVMGSCGMLLVRTTGPSSSEEFLQSLVDGHDDLEWVSVNSTQSWIIGGKLASLARAQTVLEGQHFACTTVKVPFAFHTSQMDCIMDEFKIVLDTVSFKRPLVPYLSPLLQQTVTEAGIINADYLKRACRETVNFKGAFANARRDMVLDANALFCEVGPHPIVLRYIQETLPEATTFPVLSRTDTNWFTLTKAVVGLYCAGVPVNWRDHFAEYEKAHRLCKLPAYAWNDQIHWIPYTGSWTLDKAVPNTPKAVVRHPLQTSLIHSVLKENIQETKAEISLLSDFAHPDVQRALKGHMMNKHGVASWAVYYDMSLTIGDYVFSRLDPSSKGQRHVSILDMQCHTPQLLAKRGERNQLTRIEVQTTHSSRSLRLAWYSTESEDSRPNNPCATATVTMGNPHNGRVFLATVEHLVVHRVAALDQDVLNGAASRLHKAMVYRIFENVVDYLDEYKGIESIVISRYEAYADVRLSTMPPGQWHTPPCWIDSLCQIAGFVMNGGELCNFRNEFWVTPGFDSFKLAQPLQAGATYRSYVKMAPTEEPRLFAGDVFIMSEDNIIGLVEQVKFRQLPRVLMNEFFSIQPKDPSIQQAERETPMSERQQKRRAISPSPSIRDQTSGSRDISWAMGSSNSPEPFELIDAASSPSETPLSSDHWMATLFEQLVVSETGISETDLKDDCMLADIGIDSMVSLVITTRLREKTGCDIKHSILLEHSSIGEIKKWLVNSF